MSYRAFTLVEMIVVIALTTLMIVALGSLLVYFYKTNAYVYQQATATIQARRGIDDAARYIREATYSSTGAYPIQSATASSLTFLANIDADEDLETVMYSINNGAFVRTVGSASVTLSNFVTNTTAPPVFRYYNAGGTELTLPVTLSQIASITTTLVIQVDTNRGPAAFTLTGKAVLRNRL